MMQILVKELVKKDRRLDLLGLLIVFTGTLIIGAYLSFPWSGYPKGDDALKWIVMAQNFASTFPDVMWDHTWFMGYNPYLTNSPLFSVLMTVTSLFTGSMTTAFQTIFYLSILFTGVTIYFLTRALKISRILGISLVFLFWSTPAYWGISIWGGAYDRVIAIPIIFFMIYVGIKHIRAVKENKSFTFWTILAILTYYVALLSNTLIIFFPYLILASLYFSNFTSFKRRLTEFGLTFLIPLGLSAWFRIPFITTFGQLQYQNDTTILKLSSFLIPDRIWPSSLDYAYLIVIIVTILVFEKRHSEWKSKFMVISVLTAIMIYTFIGAYIGLPPSLSLYAAYDNPLLFSITSIVWIAFVTTLNISIISRKNILAILVIVLVIGSAFYYVLADHFSNTTRYVSWEPLNQHLKKEIGAAGEDDQSRLSANERLISRWYNYDFPDSQLTGGRGYAPNPLALSYFTTRVMYKSDFQNIDSNYIDDRPLVRPADYGTMENVYPPVWWTNWFGSDRVVLLPNYYTQTNTKILYEESPYFSIRDPNSDISIFNIDNSSPISLLTDAPRVAYVGSEKGYFQFLDSLSYLGLDSNYIIPIFYEKSKNPNLSDFNALVFEQDDKYVEAKLANYKGKIITLSGVELPENFNALHINMNIQELDSRGVDGAYLLIQYLLENRITTVKTEKLANTSFVRTFTSDTPAITYAVNATGNSQNTSEGILLSLISTKVGAKQVNYSFQLDNGSILSGLGLIKAKMISSSDIIIGISLVDGNLNYISKDFRLQGGKDMDLEAQLTDMVSHGNMGIPKMLTITLYSNPSISKEELTTVYVKQLSMAISKEDYSIPKSSLLNRGGIIIDSLKDGDMIQLGLFMNNTLVARYNSNIDDQTSVRIIPFGALKGHASTNDFDKASVEIFREGQSIVPAGVSIFYIEPFSSEVLEGSWESSSKYEIRNIQEEDQKTLLIKNTFTEIKADTPTTYFAGPGVLAFTNYKRDFSYTIENPMLQTGTYISIFSGIILAFYILRKTILSTYLSRYDYLYLKPLKAVGKVVLNMKSRASKNR